MDGELSADLICISGWRSPEIWGVWADAPTAVLRFRTAVPAGTRIHLVMRLTAAAGNGRLLRISSGSGAETEVSLAGGSDRLAVLSCEVEPGDLVSVRMSMAAPAGSSPRRPPTVLGTPGHPLFPARTRVGREAARRRRDDRSAQGRSAQASALAAPAELAAPRRVSSLRRTVRPGRVRLRPAAAMDESRRAASFGAFLRSTDSYWPSSPRTSHRRAPIFADDADRQIFHNAHGRQRGHGHRADQADPPQRPVRLDVEILGRRGVRSLGSVDGRSAISTAPRRLAWLSRDAAGMWIDEQLLAAAPRHEKSYLIFYNGNLHNYYHWMTEGILSLDVLSRAMGPDPALRIALPKSMDIAALLDHRESLRAVGLDGYHIEEVAADLIHVREAIWVDSDLVQSMPAPYLRDFQQRVAARHAGTRGPRTRRLLVARRGPTRMIHNLEQVQALLSGYGFETVYLEGMSVVGSDPAVPERRVRHRPAWRGSGQPALLRAGNQGHRAHAVRRSAAVLLADLREAEPGARRAVLRRPPKARAFRPP